MPQTEQHRVIPPRRVPLQRLRRAARALGWGTILWTLCGGFAAENNARPAPKLLDDPWLEARTGCVLPLASDGLPATPEAFALALSDGMRRMAIIPAHAQTLDMHSGAYPDLQSLHIDLSNAEEDADHRPPKLNHKIDGRAGIETSDFELHAAPLLIYGAKISYEMKAKTARMDLRRDRQNRPVLLMVGATDGQLSIDVDANDIQKLCFTAAKSIARKYGFDVTDVKVRLVAPTPSKVFVELRVVLGGMLGGNLWFGGRFEVADDLSATASHLSVQGDGPGGALISSLLSPALAFYDGKTRQFLEFPENKIQLTSVQFAMDTALHIHAAFADAKQ